MRILTVHHEKKNQFVLTVISSLIEKDKKKIKKKVKEKKMKENGSSAPSARRDQGTSIDAMTTKGT